MKNKLPIIGGIGTGILALCCFTPALVVALNALGAAGMVIYLDIVLLPLLGFFILLTGYGLYRAKKERDS